MTRAGQLRPTRAERLDVVVLVACAALGATLGLAAWWCTLCLICLENVR
jgi:hypothetical protein